MLLFELIQVALRRRKRLSITPSESEWKHLYQLAGQHTLQAICYHGITLLPDEQRPSADALTNWIWQARRTEERNQMLTQHTIGVCRGLWKRNFDACVLKGQGIGLAYGDLARYRYPGDVDVWAVPHDEPDRLTRRRVIAMVREAVGHLPLVRYHHIDLPVYEQIRVELHFVPMYLNDPLSNQRLKRWFREQRPGQMSHTVRLGTAELAVPTAEFNALYLLLHISKHLFEEGVGLRQLMDYYFVLLQIRTPEQKAELQRMIRRLRLDPLAGAVMYIMTEVFGYPYGELPYPQHHKHGIALLSEIMQGGDFGRYDTRYDKNDKGSSIGASWHRFWRKTKRNLALSYHFTNEGLWEPINHIRLYYWEKVYRLVFGR